MLLESIVLLKNKLFYVECANAFPLIYLCIFVPSSCDFLFLFSLLLSMTALPPSSHQNSHFAEECLIYLYVFTLKVNIGN